MSITLVSGDYLDFDELLSLYHVKLVDKRDVGHVDTLVFKLFPTCYSLSLLL